MKCSLVASFLFEETFHGQPIPSTLLPATFSFGDTIRQKFSQKSLEKIQEPKAMIQQKIEEVPQEMIEKVMENFRKRL